jgi:hypothetical protein
MRLRHICLALPIAYLAMAATGCGASGARRVPTATAIALGYMQISDP